MVVVVEVVVDTEVVAAVALDGNEIVAVWIAC